jgi:hypothetical protein
LWELTLAAASSIDATAHAMENKPRQRDQDQQEGQRTLHTRPTHRSSPTAPMGEKTLPLPLLTGDSSLQRVVKNAIRH